MLVTHRQAMPIDEYLAFIKICAVSGITAVQLREKNMSYESTLIFGRKLKQILEPFEIPLIVNDNLDLAVALDAEGIHLGQSDGDPKAARALLGPHKIIGVSINSLENLCVANGLPINYVGIGAIFKTHSKLNVATTWGLEGLRELSKLSKHTIIAIGGINELNAAEVILAGAEGLAIIGAIHNAVDPSLAIKRLRQIGDTKDKIHA